MMHGLAGFIPQESSDKATMAQSRIYTWFASPASQLENR
jgi:hypothetical protein